MSREFLQAAVLLFVLLNPFSLSVYLLDLINAMSRSEFGGVLRRGATIATCAFVFFALTGEFVFTEIFQVRFASFLIFGGVVLLIIALRLMFIGTRAIAELRGSPQAVAGSIAMPFMIGPGTVSASVLAGARLEPLWAVLAILAAVTASSLIVFGFKLLHDRISSRNEGLVERYTDLVGRISALVTGMISVDMVFRGVRLWHESVS